MGDIKVVPKHVAKQMLPGLKIGGLVKTLRSDYSQDKGFVTKALPAGSVGRVKRIFDFGVTSKEHRFLIDIKFDGHPITNFYTEELAKVRV